MSKSSITLLINSFFPEPQASLLNGMLFGIPLDHTTHFYKHIQAAGLLHMVVLSGTNITIIGAIVGSLLSFLPKHLAVWMTICLIVIFVIFVGPQPPIIRAACMGVLSLLAVIFHRKTIALYSLFLSALFIAILWPEWLTSVSFLLSYAATFGIIIFSTNQLKVKRNYFHEETKLTLAAQLFTTPIIFIYFKQISFVAPLSNILVSFAVVPITILGFLSVAIGILNHTLALPIVFILHGLLTYVVMVIDFLGTIPYGFVAF